VRGKKIEREKLREREKDNARRKRERVIAR